MTLWDRVSVLRVEADVAAECERLCVRSHPGLLPPPLPDIRGLSSRAIRALAWQQISDWASERPVRIEYRGMEVAKLNDGWITKAEEAPPSDTLFHYSV